MDNFDSNMSKDFLAQQNKIIFNNFEAAKKDKNKHFLSIEEAIKGTFLDSVEGENKDGRISWYW